MVAVQNEENKNTFLSDLIAETLWYVPCLPEWRD